MSAVEYCCVFVRASGDRLLAAERLVLAFPHLFGPALVETDLYFRTPTKFLGIVLRFGEPAQPGWRERLAFWSARAGGRASPLTGLVPGEEQKIREHLGLCEQAKVGVVPAALSETSARFFSAAGAPAARRRSTERPVLGMDVGGPGWEGVRFTPGTKQLFIAAPMSPPVGDVIALGLRLPGADRPAAAGATVIEVRTAAAAGPGLAAGYTLRLDVAAPGLVEALASHAPPPTEGEIRYAPRFPVNAPVHIIAPPPLPSPSPSSSVDVRAAAAAAATAAGPQATIEYASDQELAADFIENLSQGGAFVRSSSPHPVGTTLTLELKLPNGADLSTKAVVAFSNQNGMGLKFTLDEEADEVLSAAIAHISARPRRALVVDDDALIRQMIADALRDRGFEVMTAADATEGLGTLSEELLALDLLLTDIRMPGMDGEEFVRLIRKTGGETDLAIVAVTGDLGDGVERKLELAGADAVLDKALGVELIAQAADAVLERKRLAAE